MNTFDTILLNTILVLFPIFLYLIYLYTNKSIKYKIMCFILTIFTSIILVIKYGILYNNYKSNIISFLVILFIVLAMYKTSKNILKDHLTHNELLKNNQIHLSLFKITHEIKNPIAVIKCYLDMINIEEQEQVKKYIPIIKSEIDRILILLQDFLLINKLNLNKDTMDINLLLEEQINKLNYLMDEKNIKLDIDLIDEDVYINGDYNRLGQVILNLIKNSVESFDKQKNKIIKISSNISSNNYNLIIEDNGNGMSKDVLKKIKEPFYTTKKRGSGLGISLSNEIIKAHQGTLKYISEENKGTKAIINIPINS